MGAVKADIRALKKLRDKIAALENGGDREKFCEDCAKKLAAELISLATKRTPVKTGYLRRGWTAGSVEKHGDTYTITVKNPVEYAPYVEYGHRQTPGRYVPEIGKRLTKNWAAGQYMLTLSEEDLREIAPSILEKRLNAFLREVFNG